MESSIDIVQRLLSTTVEMEEVTQGCSSARDDRATNEFDCL